MRRYQRWRQRRHYGVSSDVRRGDWLIRTRDWDQCWAVCSQSLVSVKNWSKKWNDPLCPQKKTMPENFYIILARTVSIINLTIVSSVNALLFVIFSACLGRDEDRVEIIEAYLKAIRLYRDFRDASQDPEYSEVITLSWLTSDFVTLMVYLMKFFMWRCCKSSLIWHSCFSDGNALSVDQSVKCISGR